ncbi:MAG: ABC transporter ATP-binding protein [Anaerolineae bacterium]|nr:ABC transporter ATP-binding protein [Anaerolineae bacterium]
MIVLEGVTKVYTLSQEHKVTAVHDVSLEVAPGEFLLVTGRSGSGKTTLLNLIAGLTRPTTGRVLWNGVDLWSMSDRQQARLRSRRVGFVFQFPSLLPALTMAENVVLPSAFSVNGDRQGAHEQAAELLSTVGLADKLLAYPRQVSAGQQQRAVIARALFNRPEVLLADEPTSDLDEKTEREIMDLFQAVHADTGLTIILVTHTAELVSYGTRHVRMAGGQITTEED